MLNVKEMWDYLNRGQRKRRFFAFDMSYKLGILFETVSIS